MDGDVGSGHAVYQLVRQVHKVPWSVLAVHQGNEDAGHGVEMDWLEDSEPVEERQSAEDVSSNSLHHLQRIARQSARNSRSIRDVCTVETRFVSTGRFEVCVQSRRITVSQDDDVASFETKVKDVWRDVVDDAEVHIHLVLPRPSPESSSSCGHVIVQQGVLGDTKTLLLKAEALPPLQQLRAVLFHDGRTVLDIFRIALIVTPCYRGDVACYLCAMAEGHEFFDTDEVVEVPNAFHMRARARIIAYSDNDESGSDGSTAEVSTVLISDDEEEGSDASSVVSLTLDVGVPTWAARMPEIIELPQVPDGHHFAHEGMDIDDEFVFHDDHVEDIDNHLHLLSADHPGPNQRCTAITFGLGVVSLGRRDFQFRCSDINDLLARARNAWADHVARANAKVVMVYPQPILQPVPNIVLIVGFDYDGDEDNGMRMTLVQEDAEFDYQPREEPYASWIDPRDMASVSASSK